MSMYDLQGMAAQSQKSTAGAFSSSVSWWSCGDHRPSEFSAFACG